jgi:hypothetical protein
MVVLVYLVSVLACGVFLVKRILPTMVDEGNIRVSCLLEETGIRQRPCFPIAFPSPCRGLDASRLVTGVSRNRWSTTCRGEPNWRLAEGYLRKEVAPPRSPTDALPRG